MTSIEGMEDHNEVDPLLIELVQRNGCGSSLPCDPRRFLHRYIMLIFLCFLLFGSYFCYDNPAALQDVMIRTLDLTFIEFMNLYAFCSWPNVILSFVGGFLIDRVFGTSLGAIIFSLFLLVAQVLFGLGAMYNAIWLMYLGRFIFGVGGESLSVAANTYTTEWFPPSELNLVFGLQLSMARIGSTVNMVSMQRLFDKVGQSFGIRGAKQLGASLIIAAVTCLFSLFCALVIGYYTRRAKRILCSDVAFLSAKPQPVAEEGEKPVERPKISLKDVLHFPAGLWLICVICVTYYVAIFPFVSLGVVFFERKFQLSIADSGVVNSLIYIVSAVGSPVFGAAIDYTGRNLNWMLLSILITMACHLVFAFTSGQIPPIVITIVMGLSYSILASSLWPLVAYLLPPHQRGTAYGLINAVQNLGLGVISILAGFIVDSKGYLFLEVFFVLCLSVAVLGTWFLYIWDVVYGGEKLNESGSSRRNKPDIEVPKDITGSSQNVRDGSLTVEALDRL